MAQLDLSNKIVLQIIGTDIEISDLDIDFEIELTNEADPNSAKVTIWNLSQQTMTEISENFTAIRILYQDAYTDGLVNVYTGQKRSKTEKTSGKSASKTKRQQLTASVGSDVGFTLFLAEDLNNFSNSFFSKSYETEVSTRNIISDIARTMQAGVFYTNPVEHNVYKNGKAFNQPSKSALNEVCKRINCNWSLTQGAVNISPLKTEKKQSTFLFDGETVESPQILDNDEFSFETRFIPQLKPDMWVRVETRDYNGTYRITKVKHSASNYSVKCTSEVTLKED